MERQVRIQWTETAKNGLRKLPQKVRKGLFRKVDDLAKGDPSKTYKPLTGPLQGYYRIRYSRYRAIYTVEEESIANGDVLTHVRVLFVAVGIRKEGDKHDIYKLAEKLVELGLISTEEEESEED